MQRCPECDEVIEADSINIEEGVALCGACGRLSRLSHLRLRERSSRDILDHRPSGCSIEETGRGFVARASLRSTSGFLGATAVALFWNGIVSVFVLLAAAGLYANLVGPIPEWFPMPGGLADGKPIVNDEPMGLGMTIFLCVFLIPFVVVGTAMAGAALLYLVGEVRVVVEETDAYVATGVWLLAWRKRFDPGQVHEIHEVERGGSEGGSTTVLEVIAERAVRFGSMLADDRRAWLFAVLRERLVTAGR